MDNLESVIEDAVNDAVYNAEDTPTDIPETPVETSADVDDAPAVDEVPQDAGAESPSLDEPTEEIQAQTPATKADQPKDPFEELAGMPQTGAGGRENRIPYSRVKKITEKAVSEVAEAALGRKLNPGEKAIDVVKQHVAQLPQLIETNKDYESRLSTVGEFEQVMANQPERFLQMLARIPAYGEFFKFVENAYSAYESGAFGRAAGQAAVGQQTGAEVQNQQPTTAEDPMPEPDETLADGSKQYSLDGVRKLLDWNSRQVTNTVTKDLLSKFDQRLKPIETERQKAETARINAQKEAEVKMQIAEARTWPMFNESEAEITEALAKNKNLSLEAAYRQVAFPKILADRTRIKQDVIQEMQKAPTTSSAVGPRISTKPQQKPQDGPRNLEDIIREQVASLRQ